MKKVSIIKLFAMLFVLVVCHQATAQIKWDFDQGTGTASAVSSTIPANITVSDFSFGNTFGTVTPMVTNTSASNYTGASGNYNATVSANANTPFSTSGNTYFTFTLTPSAGYAINMTALQFAARSIAAGPNAYQIYTSADNYATSIAGNSLTNNSSWVLKQPTFTAVSVGAGIPLTVRVYGYSGVSPVSGTANWRIDDLAVTVSVVMPINLKSFSIALNNNLPQLNWQTSQEINAAYFAVEKSRNGKDFVQLAKVTATNKPNGSSYQFADAEKLVGTRYFRLRMVDRDGSYKYSNILSVTDKQDVFLKAYPNPTTTNSISIAHPKAGTNAVIKIIGINGTVFKTKQVLDGTIQNSINLMSLQQGIYMAVFENGASSTTVFFCKQ